MSHLDTPPPSLSAAAIAKAIFEVEAALDLEDPVWVQDDVHWWPLYRLEIYRLLFASQATAEPAASKTRLHQRLRQQLGPAWKAPFFSASAAERGCVWLVSDGLSWSRLGDQEVERFCTPLQRWCTNLGVRSTIIDRASAALRLGQPAGQWWAPAMQRLKIAAAVLTYLSPNPQHAEMVHRVVLAATQAGIKLPVLSARRFDTMARAVMMMAKLLAKRIQDQQVRAVFLVSFYDVSGYAFALAAARAGVRCVDVQHGVTGPHHLAYTPWPTLPRFQSGWRLLPTHFWSWSTADAELINGWGKESHPPRHAVQGGHPFLQAWAEGSMHLPAAMQVRLDRLLLAAEGRQRVLVTLQPGLTHADALAPLLQAWKLRPKVTWWLRLHPMALAEGPTIQALAQAHGLENFDIETATALPLPALLAQAHVHATHSSSTVIEAQTMGLTSVVWSGYGAELAQDQLAAGAACVALEGAALVDALTQAPRPHHLTQVEALATMAPSTTGAGSDNQQPQGPEALRRLLELNP